MAPQPTEQASIVKSFRIVDIQPSLNEAKQQQQPLEVMDTGLTRWTLSQSNL